MICGIISVENQTGIPPTPGLAPVASFDPPGYTEDVGEVIFFDDTSENTPTSWAWYIDGALFSIQQNPAYYFGWPGTYVITLTATNEWGSDSHSETYEIDDFGGGRFSP